MIGHIFPAFYSFKGGKGILCSGTLLLLLDWRIAAVGWGLFALLWLTTRYVSLGSVSGAVSFPVTTLIFCPGNWTVFVLSLLIAALVIWAHREISAVCCTARNPGSAGTQTHPERIDRFSDREVSHDYRLPHAHIPGSDRASAVARLSDRANIPAYSSGTAGGLLLAERAAGVDRSIILPVATKPEQVHHINDAAAAHNEHAFVTNMFSFACIHPDYEDWKQELDRIAARNMRGIKLHPAYQQTDLDDPKYLRILERAGALGLIVVTHAGFDIGFPGCRCCTPEKARNALQEVGPVTLVLAHMGGWRCWDAVPELLADTTALLDTAFSLRPAEAEEGDPQWLSDEAFVNLVRTFGAERILFGTDSPWADPQAELQHIRALPLSEEERAAILGGNAKRLLRI